MEVNVTKENFESVTKNHDFVIIDFFANWCMPCKMLANELEELQVKYPSVVVGRVDCDLELELARKFNIYSIPNLFIFYKGEEVSSIVGYMSASELESKLGKWLTK